METINKTNEIYDCCTNKTVKDNLEFAYFHTIWDITHNVYWFEVANGWHIPQYVKKWIANYMKQNYGAITFLILSHHYLKKLTYHSYHRGG